MSVVSCQDEGPRRAYLGRDTYVSETPRPPEFCIAKFLSDSPSFGILIAGGQELERLWEMLAPWPCVELAMCGIGA